MKKFLALSASALLATSLFAFTACNNGGDGVIPGNYVEATPEKLTEVVSNIDTEKLMDELKGIEFNINLTANYAADGMSFNGTVTESSKIVIGDNNALSGAGEASVNATLNNGGTETKMECNANAYIDSQYAYANVTGLPSQVAENGTLKAKVDYMELVSGLMSYNGLYALAADVAQGGTNEEITEIPNFDVTTVVAMLEAYHIGVAIDEKDGLKVRLSLSEDTLWAIVDSVNENPNVAFTQLKEAISFNKFVFDVYFAIDANGAFNQFSINIDIDARGDGATIGAATDLTFTAKGSIVLKAFNGSVNVPGDLASNATYVDMTDMLGDIIGDTIGGGSIAPAPGYGF